MRASGLKFLISDLQNLRLFSMVFKFLKLLKSPYNYGFCNALLY